MLFFFSVIVLGVREDVSLLSHFPASLLPSFPVVVLPVGSSKSVCYWPATDEEAVLVGGSTVGGE